MRSFAHVVADRQGLHARACVVISHEATKWTSDIRVRDNEQRVVDAKSMMSLLSLRAAQGDELIVTCKGSDEVEAAGAMEALMRMTI